MQALKAIARAILPEPALRVLRDRYRRLNPPMVEVVGGDGSVSTRLEWEMMPDTDATWRLGEGWSHASIVEKQKAGWPGFLEGLAAARPLHATIPDDPELAVDVSVHNTLMIFLYLLGRLASERQGSRPSVLDWGGGIGQYFRYARTFYPAVDWDYVVREVGPLAAAGALLNPEAGFVSDDQATFGRRYDAVFASGAIMYTRDLYGLAGRLCDAAGRYLLVTRTPFVLKADDFVVVQRPYRYGYDTEYAGWFINRDRFLSFVEARGFRLEREFPLAERPMVPNAPEQCRYRSYLFRRVDDGA